MPEYLKLRFDEKTRGFNPLVFLGLRDVGGWTGLASRVPETFMHSWTHLGAPSANPMGVEWIGMMMRLGFVLSFGYWCTDFLVVQRAMVTSSMAAARRTPLIAAVPKMLFPFLVIVPGMIALGLTTNPTDGASPLLPMTAAGTYDYNMALPMMIGRYYPSGLLGLGLTALLASFMAGMAGNATAFNTVWTYDIYQAYVRPNGTDAHFLWMGRVATVVGIAASVATVYVAMRFNNIMDVLQLVFSFVNAPLFATFLLGMFWPRATGHAAKPLGRNLGMVNLLLGHHPRKHGDHGTTRARTARAGLRAHPKADRFSAALARSASHRGRCSRLDRDAERHVLVTPRCNSIFAFLSVCSSRCSERCSQPRASSPGSAYKRSM